MVALDVPNVAGSGAHAEADDGQVWDAPAGDDRLYARCIVGWRDLHVDPYDRVADCGGGQERASDREAAESFGRRSTDAPRT